MVAAITNTDGALPLARRRLGDAVRALADPVAVSVGGTYRWSTAVYVELRGALRGSRARRSRGVPQSTFPCRVDTLVLLVDIDTAVATWEPHGKGTIDRLHQLAGRPWRPQDCVSCSTLTAASCSVGFWTRWSCWTRRRGCTWRCPARCAGRRSPTTATLMASRFGRGRCGCRRTAASAGRVGRSGSRAGFTGWRGCWGVRRCQLDARTQQQTEERFRGALLAAPPVRSQSAAVSPELPAATRTQHPDLQVCDLNHQS